MKFQIGQFTINLKDGLKISYEDNVIAAVFKIESIVNPFSLDEAALTKINFTLTQKAKGVVISETESA